MYRARAFLFVAMVRQRPISWLALIIDKFLNVQLIAFRKILHIIVYRTETDAIHVQQSLVTLLSNEFLQQWTTCILHFTSTAFLPTSAGHTNMREQNLIMYVIFHVQMNMLNKNKLHSCASFRRKRFSNRCLRTKPNIIYVVWHGHAKYRDCFRLKSHEIDIRYPWIPCDILY